MNGVAERDLLAALAKRHQPPAWAFLTHVSDSTGGAHQRTADAIAMSLWPSRGLELHGIEVKTTRSDWLRELRDPAKADLLAGLCDRWWVAAPAGVVADGELPPTWGLYTVTASGARAAVQAPLLAHGRSSGPITLPRGFLAALLRASLSGTVPVESVARLEEQARRQGYDKGVASAEPDRVVSDLQQLRKAVGEFTARSGVEFHHWAAGDIGDAVKAVLDMSYRGRGDAIRAQAASLARAVVRLREDADAVDAAAAAADAALAAR